MTMMSKTRVVVATAALALGAVPALAQDFQDPSYGPRQRYADEMNQPYELDGLEIGREGPLFTNEDLGIRRPRGSSFEWEAPPIGSTLPVLPDQ